MKLTSVRILVFAAILIAALTVTDDGSVQGRSSGTASDRCRSLSWDDKAIEEPSIPCSISRDDIRVNPRKWNLSRPIPSPSTTRGREPITEPPGTPTCSVRLLAEPDDDAGLGSATGCRPRWPTRRRPEGRRRGRRRDRHLGRHRHHAVDYRTTSGTATSSKPVTVPRSPSPTGSMDTIYKGILDQSLSAPVTFTSPPTLRGRSPLSAR